MTPKADIRNLPESFDDLLRAADRTHLSCAWFCLGNAALVEVALHARPDFVVIDKQHGLWERTAMESAIGLARHHVPVIVRCAANSPHAIAEALDAGAVSVMVPLIESAEQARSAVSYALYPPAGVRSAGGIRPILVGLQGMAESWVPVSVGVMIETVAGVEQVEDIAAVPGLSYLFIGTGDLRLSRGTLDPQGIEADCQRVLAAARTNGLRCGIFTGTTQAAARQLAAGYDFVVACSDIELAQHGFEAAVAALRPQQTAANPGGNMTAADMAGRLKEAAFPVPEAAQAEKVEESAAALAAQAAVVGELIAVLGADIVTAAPDFGSRRVLDWSGTRGEVPIALLRPRSTQQVSQALALCKALGQTVVTQGGLTGLAGGANAQGGEVALSLERMNQIEEIDTISGTITVQAGAILQTVQEAAARAGMLFPLDLGARGSCTIGGNLATNAGGNRVIKYGMARELVLGLEAVLADGTVISDMQKMIKNNSGYDLKNLLIGSEGTLGVITRAVMRLSPRPAGIMTAWCGLPSFDAVTRLLNHAQQHLSGGVSAFEVMWPSYYDFVVTSVKGIRAPLDTPHAFYVLLESVGSNATTHATEFESMLEGLLEDGCIENAALASSVADANAFWAVRDAPGEFPLLLPNLIGFDISFSIADVGAFANACETMLHARWPGMTALVYGHLGDGNLHVIAHHAEHLRENAETFHHEVDSAVYALTRDWHGAVSAEHGIGAKKRAYLRHTRGAGAVTAMRAIKQALDPMNLLNPGKIFAPVSSYSNT